MAFPRPNLESSVRRPFNWRQLRPVGPTHPDLECFNDPTIPRTIDTCDNIWSSFGSEVPFRGLPAGPGPRFALFERWSKDVWTVLKETVLRDTKSREEWLFNVLRKIGIHIFDGSIDTPTSLCQRLEANDHDRKYGELASTDSTVKGIMVLVARQETLEKYICSRMLPVTSAINDLALANLTDAQRELLKEDLERHWRLTARFLLARQFGQDSHMHALEAYIVKYAASIRQHSQLMPRNALQVCTITPEDFLRGVNALLPPEHQFVSMDPPPLPYRHFSELEALS